MKDMHRLDIDEEFEQMLDPLTQLEFDQLKENIRRDGCIDPVRVWRRTIVDGHNRYKICSQLGIPFDIEEINFVDRNEAKRWIAAHQLGRRNLSMHRKRYYRGLVVKGEYDRTNQPLPKNKGKKRITGVVSKNDGWRATKKEIQEELSLKLNVTPRTLRNDVKMAEALDKIHPSLRTIILDDAYKSTVSDVLLISELSQETHRLILESIRRSGTKDIRVAMQPVLATKGQKVTVEEIQEKVDDPEFMTKAHWNAKLDVIAGGCIQLADTIPTDLKKEWALLLDRLRSASKLAKSMRWFRRCPACNGDGCDTCGYHGYVTRKKWIGLGNDPSAR